MNPDNDPLRTLLGQWRDIEPGPDFAAQVRQRLRHPPAERVSLIEFLWSSRLAYATAAAAAVLLWIAALGIPGGGAGNLPAFSALHNQSLTGAYAQLLNGRTP
jgi:hypothetical protein